ncbi:MULTISPECIES: hypothetical protein [Bacillaceae]|nr:MULTISPECIES: hypothetical protein [Bacillaceae]
MNFIQTVKTAMNAYGKHLVKAQEYGLLKAQQCGVVIEQNK